MSTHPNARPTRPALKLSLQFADARHRSTLARHKVARWIRSALDAAPAEITVRIVGETEGRELNRSFRGKDYATNVLTFAYHDAEGGSRPGGAAQAPLVSADLVLCAPVVEREAREQALSIEAHYAHLLVHGSLHAQGHDHEDEVEAAAMEAIESRVMQALGFADPYAAPVTT